MSGQQIGAAVAVRPGNRRWVSGRRFRVVLCASGMCFMIMLDSNIVAVSLPSIARDPGAAFSDIEWVVSAYVLTFAALLMPSGALTVGLAIVALGNIATAALVAAHESYAVIAIGMVVTGCGAGLLNGETAKVSMSVIPPERGGMASGISGTLRFIGLVTGITGLGAVLASGTQTHFIRTVATSGLSGSVAGSTRSSSRESSPATLPARWSTWRRLPGLR